MYTEKKTATENTEFTEGVRARFFSVFSVAKSFLIFLLFASSAAMAGLPIQHWQSASGAQVYFVENHDLPILDVSVNFPAGSSFDNRDKAGTAAMTQGLLALGCAR